jgi:hypothetical protein
MEQYQDDIKHIRTLMERSATFMSLSGLSGVGAGITALVGCGLTFYILDSYGINYFDGKPNYYSYALIRVMGTIAILTLAVALFFGIYFTVRKSRRLGTNLWSKSTKNLLVSLGLPLVTGGILCIILTFHQLFYLVAPCMLLFYGLALVSASKYTEKEIFNLGIAEITLGLASAMWVGYGLVFWGLGFGILHIVYGIAMHIKYK